MKKTNHDVKPGKLDYCQVCGSKKLFEAIDLGVQPSAGGLISGDSLHEPVVHYPLRLMICPECGLGQLDYVVDGKLLFSSTNYMYRTGISAPLRDHLKLLAEEIVSTQQIQKGSLCVDIGSNDGTLLTFFRDFGMKTVGVEPTSMAKVAKQENKIQTIKAFFDEKAARQIVKEYGKAKVVTFTNVFAHMATLGQVMRGLKILLDTDGVIVTESQYLLDIFERNQFDQIYHEHVRIYSLKSLTRLFPQYEMEVFDAKHVTTREGSIRAYAGWKKKHPMSKNVTRLVTKEEKMGLFSVRGWGLWKKHVEKARYEFMEFVHTAMKEGSHIVGDSMPTRGVVVMNYFGIHRGLIPYVAQLPGTEKVGMYIPGTQTPIVSNEIILKDKPDYILILAWHFSDFIIKNWRAKGLKSKFIIPLPKFKIVE